MGTLVPVPCQRWQGSVLQLGLRLFVPHLPTLPKTVV